MGPSWLAREYRRLRGGCFRNTRRLDHTLLLKFLLECDVCRRLLEQWVYVLEYAAASGLQFMVEMLQRWGKLCEVEIRTLTFCGVARELGSLDKLLSRNNHESRCKPETTPRAG